MIAQAYRTTSLCGQRRSRAQLLFQTGVGCMGTRRSGVLAAMIFAVAMMSIDEVTGAVEAEVPRDTRLT